MSGGVCARARACARDRAHSLECRRRRACEGRAYKKARASERAAFGTLQLLGARFSLVLHFVPLSVAHDHANARARDAQRRVVCDREWCFGKSNGMKTENASTFAASCRFIAATCRPRSRHSTTRASRRRSRQLPSSRRSMPPSSRL